MKLFEAYRAIRRHNHDMARWMYNDLLLKTRGHIIVDIDTDEDFYLEFQSDLEKETYEFHIGAIKDLRAEIDKRLPIENVPESRREAVADFLNKAINHFTLTEADIYSYAKTHGSYYELFDWGNWDMGIDLKLPATKYMIFGQMYDITEEDLQRMAEDVSCLSIQEESAQ